MEGIDAGSHPTGVSQEGGGDGYGTKLRRIQSRGSRVDASVKERNGAVLVHEV